MKTAIILITILIVASVIYLWQREDTALPINNNGAGTTTAFETYSSSTQGVSFRYPRDFGTRYVSPQDWPPQFNFITNPFTCTEAGTPTARAGETSRKVIGSKSYCVTVVTQGAAGSIYSQYAYAFANATGTAIMTFTIRRPQCANYPEPEQSTCQEEQADFNVDSVVDQIDDTLEI